MHRHWMLLGLIIVCTGLAPAYPGGISGRTQKHSQAGCGGGGCHGSGASAGVAVAIAGPETVVVGQTATFVITVTGTSGTKGGVDVAAFAGSLSPVSSTLKLLNGECVHRQRVSSPFTYTVTYTAPATAGSDTLYATGKDNVFAGWNWSPRKPLTIVAATDVDPASGIVPASLTLRQNYPNPFNPSTTIAFSLRTAGPATLKLYSLAGCEIATLASGVMDAGEHAVRFDAGTHAAGVYIYVLSAGSRSVARKMVLLK